MERTLILKGIPDNATVILKNPEGEKEYLIGGTYKQLKEVEVTIKWENGAINCTMYDIIRGEAK